MRSVVMKSGFIAIIGRPNSGKSTLLNSILGSEISIVTPKAQTTRERIFGIHTDTQKGQIVFIDTPGIHRAREGGINQYMVEEAKHALDSPNLIWYLVDPNSAAFHEEAILELLNAHSAPVFLILNKSDARQNDALEQELMASLKEKQVPVQKSVKISGLRKSGVQKLLEESWALLPEGPFYYPDADQLSDRPLRYFAAEKIREKLFYCMGDEIPYSCAVEIIKFDEKGKLPRIEAIIHVERDSQKGMVIGQGGKKIKEIGQTARVEIEKLVGSKIFLGLKVEVTKNWTSKIETLKRLGYA